MPTLLAYQGVIVRPSAALSTSTWPFWWGLAKSWVCSMKVAAEHLGAGPGARVLT